MFLEGKAYFLPEKHHKPMNKLGTRYTKSCTNKVMGRYTIRENGEVFDPENRKSRIQCCS